MESSSFGGVSGYGAYDQVLKQEKRVGAACLAHARRKFYELVKDNLSPVGTQARQRIAALYQIERQAKGSWVEARLTMTATRWISCSLPSEIWPRRGAF
nr:transposase [Rhodoferax sp.]